MGDMSLVSYPDRIQVRCHRNLSEEEICAEVTRYLALARSGVVLVSPFISPAERAVYAACYKEKLRMIHIVKRGIDGKFVYPSGVDLKGCTAGFLLVLSPAYLLRPYRRSGRRIQPQRGNHRTRWDPRSQAYRRACAPRIAYASL